VHIKIIPTTSNFSNLLVLLLLISHMKKYTESFYI